MALCLYIDQGPTRFLSSKSKSDKKKKTTNKISLTVNTGGLR